MNNSIDERMIEMQFWETMRECGIKPKHGYSGFHVEMDGNLHRFPVEGDKSGEKSGAYFCHADGWPNWGFMDYHIHDEMKTYKFSTDAMTGNERDAFMSQFGSISKEEWKAKQIAAVHEAEEVINAKKKQLALLRELYDGGLPAGVFNHPYIQQRFKSIVLPQPLWGFWGNDNLAPSHACTLRVVARIPHEAAAFVRKGELLIPVTDTLNKNFLGLEKISLTGQKGFLSGTHYTGGCFEILPMGYENAPIAYLCEGLSTGIAVAILTRGGFAVFCSLSCGNFKAVATKLRERLEGKKLILMADNDGATLAKTGRNPGIEAAEAVKAAGLVDEVIPARIPGRETENIDWFDILAVRFEKGVL